MERVLHVYRLIIQVLQLNSFLRFLAFGLELAVDSDVGILVEARVGFEAGFRLGSAFENSEIMVEETDPPFEGFDRMIVLECMCLTLRFFDHFAGNGRYRARGDLCGNAMVVLQYVFCISSLLHSDPWLHELFRYHVQDENTARLWYEVWRPKEER